MENNSPDCLVVGFFLIYLMRWKGLGKISLIQCRTATEYQRGYECVCEWEGGWGLCESPVCNKSWLLNPAPELTLKQIHSRVWVCVWVPTFSHHTVSWTQGNLYGPDGCVVGHCVVLSTAEHSDIYCLCTEVTDFGALLAPSIFHKLCIMSCLVSFGGAEW